MSISWPNRSNQLNQYSGQSSRLHLKSAGNSPIDAEFKPLFDSIKPNASTDKVIQGIVVDDNHTNTELPQGMGFSPYYQQASKARVQEQALQNTIQDPIAQRVQRMEREIRELKSLIGDSRSAIDPNSSLPSRYSGHTKAYSSLVEGLGDLKNHIANA